jgi:anti-anti-sigma factor
MTSEVRLVIQDGGATVTGKGDLDLSVGPVFRSALEECTESVGKLTVDFREVPYIDSAILQALADACVRLRGKSRIRVMVRTGSHPDYVLKTVGFGELMDIEAEVGSTA